MSPSTLLAWSFLFPVVTLTLAAFGLPKRGGALSFLSPLAIFVTALACLVTGDAQGDVVVKDWAPFLDAPLRLHVDHLTVVMLLVVGGVATCVFIYAQGYMAHDPRKHRFFAFLDFFIIAMTLLVVAGNVPVLLVGWAGVGVASFLLISFWWEKGQPLEAGYLALGANAIGDAALLIAAVLIAKSGGGDALADVHKLKDVPGGTALLAWLFVIAACAKSAQGPLWWWLPSAMAGPTPVSALIHAATMVAAGVYLMVRVEPLVHATTEVWYTTALIGVGTAVLGGIASLWQRNFKRGLAYSTVSQLGWMFAAVALGSPFAAMFHLVTHAAFKAMLFLSAGTVIEATHHEEDIRRLGGLRKKLPMANGYFLLGSLALIGTPIITAGSFSKDAILEAALDSSVPFLGWILLVSTFITGAYAGRLYAGVFLGAAGASAQDAHAPKFALFDAPLLPLAAGAIGFGYLEAGTHLLSGFLSPTMKVHGDVAFVSLLGLGAFAVGLVGFVAGGLIARLPEKSLPEPPAQMWQALWGEVRALPDGVAAVHGGRVGRYVLMSLLGAAVVLALSLAPTDKLPATPGRAVTNTPKLDAPAGKGKGARPTVPSNVKDRAADLRKKLQMKEGDAPGAALDNQRKRVLDQIEQARKERMDREAGAKK
jgi:proton-translocating NADH-quinone oxidoreductase chain L